MASECPAAGCDTFGYNVRMSARSQGDVATGIMIAGAAATVGGLALFFFAPSGGSSEAGRPVVGIGLGSIQVALRFF